MRLFAGKKIKSECKYFGSVENIVLTTIIVKNLNFDTKLIPNEFSNPCFGETQ